MTNVNNMNKRNSQNKQKKPSKLASKGAVRTARDEITVAHDDISDQKQIVFLDILSRIHAKPHATQM